VRPDDVVEKSSSSFIVAPFTHPNPEGSRFSDGTYGVLYGGLDFDTTNAEVKAARESFLRHTSQKPQRLDMRAIVMDLDGALHDLRGRAGARLKDFGECQKIARELRADGSYGLVFDSVAKPGGECVCVFRPSALSNCRQERHFAYVWDGREISRILEYSIAKTA
jgi:hypothetical protein